MREHRGLDHLPDDAYDDDDEVGSIFPRRRRKRHGDDDDDEPRGRGPLMWLLLWLFIPSLIALGFVLFGVHLGAQHPDAWYAQAIEWLVTNIYE